VAVTQGDIACSAEARITERFPGQQDGRGRVDHEGLPGYTYHKAAGELWRSRFDAERNLIVVNSGHRDLRLFRAQQDAEGPLRLPAVRRGVLKNFVGLPQDQLLERLLELAPYTEENLR
jgi:hypothetical protein